MTGAKTQVVTWTIFGLGVLSVFLPFHLLVKYLIRGLFTFEDKSSIEQNLDVDFETLRNTFAWDYDRTNPITQAEATEHFLMALRPQAIPGLILKQRIAALEIQNFHSDADETSARNVFILDQLYDRLNNQIEKQSIHVKKLNNSSQNPEDFPSSDLIAQPEIKEVEITVPNKEDDPLLIPISPVLPADPPSQDLTTPKSKAISPRNNIAMTPRVNPNRIVPVPTKQILKYYKQNEGQGESMPSTNLTHTPVSALNAHNHPH